MIRPAAVIAVLFAVSLLVPVRARAEVITNVRVPTTFDAFVPCANGGAGEDVALSGDLHIMVIATVNGQHFSAKATFQPQGMVGVGQVTGTRYRVTGGTQEKREGNLNNGQGTLSFENNFRLIGPGPGNNFTVHQSAHITVDAGGFSKAFVNNEAFVCN